jgi:hypothetical protein
VRDVRRRHDRSRLRVPDAERTDSRTDQPLARILPVPTTDH